MNNFFNNSFGAYNGGYDQDDDDGMGDAFFEDSFLWDRTPNQSAYRNRMQPRYADAYGDYRGGYGPGGGFGPRPLMAGPGSQMPPRFMPPTRGGPTRVMWGRGFGRGGPSRRNAIDDQAIRYLTRCGMPKENLKNLPHDMLALIEPEHCGLCDFSFDSFTMSRMHYNSKNHLKNQKKWLAKAQGALKPNEMPFKSRDLYCELCDIQITSKSHGDAHYEGKPHRGIVEGRKKPKNPILLQAEMQDRLMQLIRREKRFLKSTKEAVETVENTVKNVKDNSPELYCDICKTTVTCSEQMTMHMNGKRHLTKEKQHILSMMKGPQGNNDTVDEDYGNEEGGDKSESKEEGEGEDKEDEEWGNESWDNQDQPKE